MNENLQAFGQMAGLQPMQQFEGPDPNIAAEFGQSLAQQQPASPAGAAYQAPMMSPFELGGGAPGAGPGATGEGGASGQGEGGQGAGGTGGAGASGAGGGDGSTAGPGDAGWARGGFVKGPGTTTSDGVKGNLSNDEFVFTAKAVLGAAKVAGKPGDPQAGAAELKQLMKHLESLA